MTESQFWDYFIGKGLTPQGTAGLMGNLYHESGLRFNNLQNSYEKKFGMTDDEYTIACDGGLWDFVHDSAGYGLAQWTYYSRKQNLLNYAKARNVSLADPMMQLDFLMTELTSSYRSVYNVLTTTNSVRQASDVVMTQFERPADQSQAALDRRYQTSQGYYDRNAGGKTVATRQYSPLCNEIVAFGGKNCNPRLNPVSKITIHHMAGVMGAGNCARMHLRSSGSSANYYIGNSGEICGGVAEDKRAWTTGTGNGKGTNDHTAITIEVSNSKHGNQDPRWPVSDAAYKSLIRLCADICKTYGIIPHFDGTKNGSLTIHKMFQATACPGPYLEALHRSGQLERDILAAMGQTPAPAPTPSEKVLYRVQTGAYSTKDKAFEKLSEIRLKGEEGIVVLADDGLYKVQVGAFSSKANADAKKRQMEAKGINCFVTDKGGQMVVENKVKTYVVKSGDYLGKIAKQFNTSVEAICKANQIANPNRIYPGQTLIVG